MAAKPIPEGYQTVTPYLVIQGASAAIDYYKKVFGATERMRMDGPGGMIGHAELTIGGSVIMLADEFPDMGFRGPKAFGGSPVSLMLYVPNVDEVFKRALDAGAKQLRPVADQFYGDRMGTLEDPFGHVWTIGTHVEDVSPEEMKTRHDQFVAKMQQGGGQEVADGGAAAVAVEHGRPGHIPGHDRGLLHRPRPEHSHGRAAVVGPCLNFAAEAKQQRRPAVTGVTGSA
jgi:PhnB protein